LQQSNNWISAYLMDHVTPPRFADMLKRYGVRSNMIEPYMPLCLGTCDIKVSEMVSAYSTFANHGIRTVPMYVTRIVDGEGSVVADFQPQQVEVISEDSSYKMLYMLRSVIDGGTGSRIRSRYKLTCDMGGKTGTTNNNSDCWFMGFTPSLVSGVWVGGEDRDIHFDTMTYGQGAAAGLPVWALYMQKVFEDKSLNYNENERFEMPERWSPCDANGVSTDIDSILKESGMDDIFN
ncbi:MAG: penicillin-binding protein, partial [Bacteroidaceae bacterium]|nr:penicillin-binding protein [Bacteroidaceae bacterium]